MENNIEPKEVINYNIYLNIIYKNLNYNGLVEILFITKLASDYIEVDAYDIEINKVFINNVIVDYFINKSTHKLKIYNRFGINSKYKIQILFSNNFSSNQEGFMEYKYKGIEYFYTDPQPDEIVKIIPCFENPKYKATMNLIVRLDKEVDCLSNTYPKLIKVYDNNKIITFNEIPKMSTYLISLAVGKFIKYFDKPFISLKNKEHNIYSIIKKSDEFISIFKKYIITCMNYYEEYFEREYPLDKLDIVLLPSLIPGGIENIGLIFMKDLYFNCNISTLSILCRILYHEIVHQWIGNLVTLSSWNYVWLNESLTNWITWKGLFKTQNYELYQYNYLKTEYFNAQYYDSMLNTSIIYIKDKKVKSENIFTHLIYNKGSLIFKYVNSLMEDAEFRKLIVNYINKHEFGSVNPEDLIEEFKKYEQKLPLSQILIEQLSSYGFPFIDVTCIKQDKISEILIKKSRFINSSDISRSYNIPIYIKIVYINNSNNKITELLKIKSETLKIKINSNSFYLNPCNDLLCVIRYNNYDPIKEMNEFEIIKYLNDLYILMLGNYITFIEYYNKIVQYIKYFILIQNSYLILKEIIIQILKLLEIFYYNNKYNYIKEKFEFIIPILDDKIKLYIMNDYNYKEEFLNNIFILITIYYPIPKYIKLLKKLFEKNNKIITSSYINIIYNYPDEYFKVLNLFNNYEIDPINIVNTFEFINYEQYKYFKNNYIKQMDKTILRNVYDKLSKNKILQPEIVKYLLSEDFYLFINNKKNYFEILFRVTANIFDSKLLNEIDYDLNHKYLNSDLLIWKDIIDIINYNKFINNWIKNLYKN